MVELEHLQLAVEAGLPHDDIDELLLAVGAHSQHLVVCVGLYEGAVVDLEESTVGGLLGPAHRTLCHG